MKKPEDIKKGLRWCGGIAQIIKGCSGGCPYYVSNDDGCQQEDLTADALAYIQQLEAQVPRWISVEDQPEPPEDDVYWCYGYWIGSGRRHAETAEYLCGEWKIVNNFVLTHWMPLPEPPKEDDA